MDASRFGLRLKELREAAGLSQKELAEKAGLTQRAVSHWEQGLRDPAWSSVVALAEARRPDCRAVLQAPADREPAGPGRPSAKPVSREELPKRGRKPKK